MHTIFVVSSITIFREGIVDFLARQPELRVGGSSEHLEHAIAEFDLCVLDVAGHDHDAIARFFGEMQMARTPIVVVALPSDEQQVLACLMSGASGYVTREQTLQELHQVIGLTLDNGACVRPRDVPAVLRHVRSGHDPELSGRDGLEAQRARLTKREREVAQLLADCRSNREIARALGISVHTAKHHVRNTLAKLGAERRGDIVALRGRSDIFAS